MRMFVDHNTYGIPEKVGGVRIRALSWEDFRGNPPPKSHYLAHIYWGVNYQYGCYNEGCTPSLTVTVNVRPKSWRIREEEKLLQHQYGHYLIGCLCALSFLKKVTYQLTKDPKMNFGDWCKLILAQCLKQYCLKEKLYDLETAHYVDREKQKLWEAKIRDEIWEFYRFFSEKDQQWRKSAELSKQQRKTARNLSIKTGSEQKQFLRNNYKNFSIKREQSSTKNIAKTKHQITHLCDKRNSISSQIRCYKRMETEDFSHPQKQTLPIKSRMLR